jgi:hypothetical protein
MKQIHEQSRVTPVIAATQVLVVGSGPAGLAAAVSAARQGADTMLVERYGCFGGVISQVGVEGIAWYRYEGTVDVEGIGIEFERRAAAMGGSRLRPHSFGERLDADLFKVVADQLTLEAGIVPLLHCLAVDVILEDGSIKGIITESKSGRGAILAERVIDATGDADIAYRAGARCMKASKEELMGVTVIFSCSGVNRDRFLEHVEAHPVTYAHWSKNWAITTTGKEDDLFTAYLQEPFDKARRAGLIPTELTSIGGTWSTISETGEATSLNMIYMLGYDSTDVWDLTHAEMEGRRQAMLAIQALRQFQPGFEKAKLRNFGMTLGTRESRKILGDYTMTGYDVRNQARFEDTIGIFPEFLDGHGLLILPTTGRYFQIPYRIIVPQTVDNLLVVGRSVSADKIAHTALRNMMCCTVTGQAAGVAAAVSIADGVNSREVDILRLQAALKQQGVRLE